ncbi:hypothetical protein QCA50_007528 [Cerrena zonata]|uniref:Glyoxalase-like domain-containing protein n=1 Tax=Cerrena zonata TaxID=2478898 RepID=A0AAW0GG51_9APHY
MATREPSTNVLDHIVHLSPPGSLQDTITNWEELGFSVTPGGTHADGFTENALVAFKDGVYLELISFTHPLSDYPPNTPEHQARKDHPWAKKENGYIDFAFLGNNGVPSIASTINERASSSNVNVQYHNEVKGGRTRVDGKKLEWLITAPEPTKANALTDLENPTVIGNDSDIRGRLPFFCGDLTPREFRVPHELHEVTHPNNASGIAYVRLLTSQEDLPNLFEQFAIVTGVSSETTNLDSDTGSRTLHLRSPGSNKTPVLLKVSTPKDEQEQKWLENRGAGLYEVGIHGIENKEVWTPFGKLVGITSET